MVPGWCHSEPPPPDPPLCLPEQTLPSSSATLYLKSMPAGSFFNASHPCIYLFSLQGRGRSEAKSPVWILFLECIKPTTPEAALWWRDPLVRARQGRNQQLVMPSGSRGARLHPCQQRVGNEPSRTEWKNKNHLWLKKKKRLGSGWARKPQVKDTRLVPKEVGDEEQS